MSNKNIILLIIGESGSGKTSAAQYLEKTFGCKSIVSYTNREKRDGETNGVEHYFVSDNEIPTHISTNKYICAWTVFGGKYYWTWWNQFFGDDLKLNIKSKHGCTNMCTYVVDESGMSNMISKLQRLENNNEIKIYTLRIKRKNRKNISDERIARDSGNFNMSMSEFNFVIQNDDDDFDNVKRQLRYIFKRIYM